MTDEVTGGLPTSAEPTIKATQPKTGGLSIGANKGLSFNPEQSSEIKSKLLEMIAARESEKYGLGAFVENMMPTVGPVEGWAQQAQVVNAAKQNRNQDIMNMRLGIAQMDTEQQRLAQAKADKARNDAMFYQMLGVPAPATGGAAPAPAPATGGAAPAPAPATGGAAPRTGEPMAEIFALYQQDPKAAITKLIELRKIDDVQKRLLAAGVVPGSDQWNSALYANVAGSGAFVPHDVRTPSGTQQQTPLGAATATLGGKAPAAPVATTPAPAAAAPVATAPAPAPAPAATTAPNTGGFEPGSKEALAVQQKEVEAVIAGRQREAEKLGEAAAADQTLLKSNASSAAQNMTIASRMAQHVKAYPDVVGKLNQPSVSSALANLVSQGVTTPYGSIALPQINEIATQLDPASRRDPKRLEAAQSLARDFAYLQLQGSKVLNGQGAVSDNERTLIKNVVGDFTRLSPQNVLYVAKALELDAVNAKEQQALWNKAEDKGMSWKQFTKSPEYDAQMRKQYFRTANALGIKDAKWPGAAAPAAAPAAPAASAPVEDERARLRNRVKPQGQQ